jgi:hypothetical protein
MIQAIARVADREVPVSNTRAFEFWSKVLEQGPGECWPWRGGLFKDGYGQFSIGRDAFVAHRLAYQLRCGPVDSRTVIRHTCDNPPCCNPSHLIPGTQADNIKDSVSRGRWNRTGERNGRVKLTTRKVCKIRRLFAARWTIKSLAERYEVHTTTIADIVYWRTWTNLKRSQSANSPA